MKTDEVKVGAVTLGGFVILALMLTFLGGVFSFARTYKLNVMFNDVDGLKTGNEVRFAGVPVGKVDDILVDGSKVKVVMKMDEKQKIPRNSQFSIGSDGVMGSKFVSITPPQIATGLTFKPGETITGQQAGGIRKAHGFFRQGAGQAGCGGGCLRQRVRRQGCAEIHAGRVCPDRGSGQEHERLHQSAGFHGPAESG